MRVLVAGANGALGVPLTRPLVARGHSVVGLIRNPAGTDGVRALGAEPVVADALDRDDLNYLGVEHTTTEPIVRYVGDIHLAYMPYSHSVLTALGAAVLAWSMGVLAGRARLGAILGFALLSHLLLDLLTHNGDIALGPYRDAPKYGMFLYGRLAPLAFLVELAYGLVCWWIFRGGKALLAVILGFNLANISEFFRSIPGPEDALAGHPLTLVTVILVQIVITMWAVWWGGGKVPTDVGSNRDENMSQAERLSGLGFVER